MEKKKEIIVENNVRQEPTLFQYFFSHQLEISITLIGLILLGNLLNIPSLEYFIHVQGENSKGLYEKTWLDVFYVTFYFLVFTFIRTVLMDHILIPFARWYGIKKETILIKFKEQAFQFLFYSVSWSIGVAFLLNSSEPYYKDFAYLWKGYPHLELTKEFKSYYLIQMAFWFQQMYYVQFEVKRKDYLIMINHHIITNSLIIASYLTNYNRLGHIILTLMDFADIFLTFAKVLNYMKMRLLCDIMFALFFFAWIISRHIGFMMVIYSIMFDPLKYHKEPKWDPSNGVFFTEEVRVFFLILLMGLQLLMVIWFSMILKILYRVITGSNAEDVRSSDDDDNSQVSKPILDKEKAKKTV